MRLALFAPLVLFFGCALQPQSAKVPMLELEPWWRELHNDVLERHIQNSFKNHPSLQAYVYKLQQLEALKAQARAKLLPSLRMSAARSSSYEESYDSTYYSVNLSIDYDLDLFLKNRDLLQASSYDTAAYAATFSNVKNEWAAQIAKDYLHYCTWSAIVPLLRQKSELYAAYVQLFTRYYESGERSFDQLMSAKRELARAQEELRRGRLQRSLYANALRYELDELPECKEVAQLPSVHRTISWLERTPGLLALKFQILAAAKRYKSAKKGFLPDLKLSTLFGLGEERLADLVDGWILRWALELGVKLYEGGAIKAQQAEKRAKLEELVRLYRDRLLQKIRNLKAAKIAYEESGALLERIAREKELIEKRYASIDARFRSQESGGLDLLRVKIDRLDTQIDWLDSVRKRKEAMIEYRKGAAVCKEHR